MRRPTACGRARVDITPIQRHCPSGHKPQTLLESLIRSLDSEESSELGLGQPYQLRKSNLDHTAEWIPPIR